MESVAQPSRSLQLPRYGGAALLTLTSAGCLTLSYTYEGWFGRTLRITVGLGLPWIVAWIVPTKQEEQTHKLSRRSYWFRLAFSYLGVVVIGVIVILIWPFVMTVLMDSGVM